MQTRVRILGYSLHHLPVLLPLGLLVASAGADLLFLATRDASWAQLAFRLIGGGALTALIVVPLEFIDWLAIPHSVRAFRLTRWNGTRNMVVVALFILGWLLRRPDPQVPPTAALVLSFLALLLAGVTAWLGGWLVSPQGVVVSTPASLDAPMTPAAGIVAPRAHPKPHG